MVQNSMGAIQIVAADLSFADKGIASAKVILTGFVVVFAVLFLLIGVIKFYSFLIGKAQDASGNRKKKEEIPPRTVNAESVTPKAAVPVSVAQMPSAEEGIPQEVIAVISAAVASMYGKADRAKIKSIKKAGGRSAWANAGVLDNTRPF